MPLLSSYSCYIREDNIISELRHSAIVRRPFVRCMVPEEDLLSCQVTDEWSLKETNMATRSLLEIPKNNMATVCVRHELA